mgnify:CR=1 FL=1
MKTLTAKQTENMTLAQFQAAMREGKVEVKLEGSHNPTWSGYYGRAIRVELIRGGNVKG